jgi:hypothetical protein
MRKEQLHRIITSKTLPILKLELKKLRTSTDFDASEEDLKKLGN